MIEFLKRYYSTILILALPAPLWVLAAYGDNAALHDAGIWTAVLLGCWLLVTKVRGYHVRGDWRHPTQRESKIYRRLLLSVVLIDIGSQAVLFRADRLKKMELIQNFGLHSVFHPGEFELFHLILFLYFLYIFFLGARFFRFANEHLDRIWLTSAPFALGSAMALFGSRLLFGGVYNTLHFAGPLMWLCPTCASPYIAGYASTPADLFVHAAFLPPLILIASYIIPSKHAERATASRAYS